MNSNSPNTTGLIYHNDMLLHSPSLSDPKVETSHVENPTRLKSIINKFNTSSKIKSIDTIEWITNYEECDEEFVKLGHKTDSHFWYVKDIWPEGCNKEKLTLRDTYYTPNTSRAAFLSAGAIQ